MLLPPQFQTRMPQDGGLGPILRDPPPCPVAHSHEWRPSASSAAHVVCSCGVVSLREHAGMPTPAPKP